VTNVISIVATVLPSVVTLIQSLVHAQNPTTPPPTSAEVLAAFNQACASSLAKDDAWDAAHPKT
jgi:hypothetical protein